MRAAAASAAALAAAGAAAEPLMLTPLVESGRAEEARALSAAAARNVSMGHSGYFTVPSTQGRDNNIFFWYQPCLDGCDPSSAPFVLWLQGGPGGAGTFGVLGELGNWYLDSAQTPRERCFSWCRTRNCLFVDQPVGTGFSFQLNHTGQYDPNNTEYTRTSAEAMAQLLKLMLQFVQVFPELVPAPFYIAGESYAGLYTAHMADAVVRHNKSPGRGPRLNFSGLWVGDPVMNLRHQMPTYPSTLYGMGLLMGYERDQLAGIFHRARGALDAGDCPAAFKLWNSVWNDDGGGGAPGLYYEMTGSDMTENSIMGHQPKEWDRMDSWLLAVDVQRGLHFDGYPGGSSPSGEGGGMYATMVASGDFCSNSTDILARLLLVEGVDVTIYSGTADPLLGPPTTEAGIDAMWEYAAESVAGGGRARAAWAASRKQVWRAAAADADVTGYARCATLPIRTSRGPRFCYVVVRNSGHETPCFQPRAALDLLRRSEGRLGFDKSGDGGLPACAPCGGAGPFAGDAACPAAA